MRFYTASNMYLSSIQHGIQAAHCVSEMMLKILGNKLVSQWAHTHKTLICLNGGNNFALHNFLELVTREDNKLYPTAKFYEDDASMGGMLTCVGIIIPEKIYEADLTEFGRSAPELTPWELELALALKRMPLAR